MFLNADMSIITNIGYDHQQFLGDTLPEIASEKAGIIKAKKPVVIGQFLKETSKVFIEKSLELNAPIYFSDYSSDTVEIIDNKYFIVNNIKVYCPIISSLSSGEYFVLF
jgi:dihydrofolate synthase/folylpolyglutamate synthase